MAKTTLTFMELEASHATIWATPLGDMFYNNVGVGLGFVLWMDDVVGCP